MHMHVLVFTCVPNIQPSGGGAGLNPLFHDEVRDDAYVKLQNIRFI